jgi:NitT/TauT family transport system ATP-binding protein
VILARSVGRGCPACGILTQSEIRQFSAQMRFQSERREVQALSDISLSIAEGEFFALLGPTGCGKSSLLRLVSDLLAPTAGTIAVRGKPAAAARHLNQFGFVFQEPALLSWRTALGNVQLPLEVVGYPPEKRIARCHAVCP